VVTKGIFISSEDGIAHTMTLEPVTNPRPLFEKIIKPGVITVPLTRNASVIIDPSAGKATSVVQLAELALNMEWFCRDTDPTVVTPYVRPQDIDPTGPVMLAGMQSLLWRPGNLMIPVFSAVYDLRGMTIAGLRECFLTFVDKETGEAYAPPLPNVYETGKLCTGDIGSVPHSVFDAVIDVLEQWSANAWNRDLMNEWKRSFLETYFRFDLKTGNQNVTANNEKPLWFRELPVAGVIPGATDAAMEAYVSEIQRIIKS